MTDLYLIITPADCRGTYIELSGAKYHHLVRVRRVQVGTRLRAALPDGGLLLAEVSEITPEVLRATITGEERATGLSPCRLTLCQAVLKGEKMDLLAQKACELGVTTFVPLLAQRSIPRWTPAQGREKADRWQRIADSAAEQSERSVPMIVEPPQGLAATLETETGLRLLLHEREGRPLPEIASQFAGLRDLSLFLGPEGGWTDGEVDALRAAGAVPIHLGGRILRAETAAIAAVTLAQYLWGDLGTPSLEG